MHSADQQWACLPHAALLGPTTLLPCLCFNAPWGSLCVSPPAVQAVDAAGSHIVVGGEGMQPSLWDLSTAKKVWQGKGGKPNRVGLVDKPFPTAAAFLPSSGDSAASNGAAATAAAAQAGTSGQGEEAGSSISRRFVVGSAVAKLHVYDTAAGKRPQQEAVFGESRITALAVQPDGESCSAAAGWQEEWAHHLLGGYTWAWAPFVCAWQKGSCSGDGCACIRCPARVVY